MQSFLMISLVMKSPLIHQLPIRRLVNKGSYTLLYMKGVHTWQLCFHSNVLYSAHTIV